MSNRTKTMDEKRAIALLINEQDIKVHTSISANKVETSLINYIKLAQDLIIKKTIGETLFTQLLNEWIDSGYDKNKLPDGTFDIANPPIISGDTTNYKELYNHVYMPLIWHSYRLSLPFLAIKVSEAGVTLSDTEFSQSAGLVGLDRLQREAEDIANLYTDELLCYVQDSLQDIESVKEEAEDVGGSHVGIFVAKRGWRNFDNKCKKYCDDV